MSEARESGRPVHFGKLMELCVEKNSDIPGQGKYKLRVVYRGDCVKDEWGGNAIFKDITQCPAILESAKIADMVSCLPGCTGQQGDANQAFPQALFKGTETWIEIPRSRWPKSWHNRKWKPVCRLLRALDGHPEPGGGTGSSIVKPTL